MVTYGQVEFSMWSYWVCIVLCVHFGKAEAAYRRPQTLKPWPCIMLESYILLNTYLCYFLHVCISMNNTENAARACVNSRYQALFSPITERLGTRLVHDRHQPLHPKFGHGSRPKQNSNPGGHSSQVTSIVRYRASLARQSGWGPC